jgi:hypothetical protein
MAATEAQDGTAALLPSGSALLPSGSALLPSGSLWLGWG